jgi:ElaA protein
MSAVINWKIKPFNELSLQELYSVLKLRSIVFVVEQNCVYQDIDGKDQKALHLIGEYNNEIVAYARLFKSGDYFENASIGRVVIHPDARDKKFGHEMMRQAIAGLESHFNETKITISAQLYLQKFYESHGFVVQGETYLEDDIPHVEMLRG